MKKTGMNNPFDASVSLATIAETIVKKDSSEKQTKEPKTTDKIKVFLACVPSLENAKTDLLDIIDQVDEETKAEVEGFIKQIEGIQVGVLKFTQMTISQSVVAKETAPQVAPQSAEQAQQASPSLSDVLTGKVAESEIEKIVLSDVHFSGGKIVSYDRSAGSRIRQIPDATR